MPQVPSTRWSPTPEQLMILEEMYRCGVRTPNASQIQHITSHLSNYGKIEGKNVFYWFQNHKARERQKLRRRLSKQHQLPLMLPISQLPLPNHDSSQLLHGMHTHYLQFTGGAFPEQRSQGMDLLNGMEEDGGNRAEASFPLSAGRPFRWGCKPPKTLELFPTTRSGFKDECSTSKSSTSSPSTN